jgi:hypothetical protein
VRSRGRCGGAHAASPGIGSTLYAEDAIVQRQPVLKNPPIYLSAGEPCMAGVAKREDAVLVRGQFSLCAVGRCEHEAQGVTRLRHDELAPKYSPSRGIWAQVRS